MIKVVVPISGGKDSQACLKLALETYDKSEILGLFCDTQFEHPETYLHIDRMRILYGVTIERISEGSVPEKVLKYKRFPGGGARHCTSELKIIPSKKFYKAFAENQGGFQVWLGMRAGESSQRAKRYQDKINTEIYPPHEILRSFPKYLYKMGVTFKLPILDWEESDVYAFLDGEQNSLYKAGFDRVGCFPCLAAGDASKERAFSFGEFGNEQRIIVKDLELRIGRSVFKSKGGKFRNDGYENEMFTGCAMCAI